MKHFINKPPQLFEDESGEVVHPTSSSANIASTFESNPKSVKTLFRFPKEKYYVQEVTDETCKKVSNKTPKDITKKYTDYLLAYNKKEQDREKDIHKTFLTFKHLKSLPSSYKVMADQLLQYYTD